jgi:hypothetical protein
MRTEQRCPMRKSSGGSRRFPSATPSSCPIKKQSHPLRRNDTFTQNKKGCHYLPFFAFQAFHRARWAAAIRALACADRVLRWPDVLTPVKAAIAAFSLDNWFSTWSRSFFNCFTMLDTAPIVESPLTAKDHSRDMKNESPIVASCQRLSRGLCFCPTDSPWFRCSFRV